MTGLARDQYDGVNGGQWEAHRDGRTGRGGETSALPRRCGCSSKATRTHDRPASSLGSVTIYPLIAGSHRYLHTLSLP